MGIFDKKKEISRRELRWRLRNASPYVPGGGFLSRQERVELEKNIDRIFGNYITEAEFKKALRRLQMRRYNAKTDKERLKFDRAIRYLKKIAEHSPAEPVKEKTGVKEKITPEKRESRIGVLRKTSKVKIENPLQGKSFLRIGRRQGTRNKNIEE